MSTWSEKPTLPSNSLEKEMVTHFSILAWRIPMDRGAWQATAHGVTRVGHNLVTKPPPSPPSKYMQNLFLTNSTTTYQIQLIILDLDYSVTS